ncbi:hypothetical protein [Sphingomonas sp.]|uniref:hypothetical protein n=1 Tax=Sphingomonas sp. TaxID=28214 RepID=UPI0035A8279E
MHVVWARTDLDTMTLRSDSQNYHAHERASLRLEQEFGHELVPGKHARSAHKTWPVTARGEMTAHADRLAFLAITTGPAARTDCQPCASGREIGFALCALNGACTYTEPYIAFHGVCPTRQEGQR